MKKDQLEELYKKQYKAVYYYMLSLCHNKEQAEDIVSQAFEKALFALDSSVNNYTHWLMRVSKNLWIDQLRKESKVSKVSIDDVVISDKEEEIAAIIHKEDSAKELHLVIDELNSVDKEIIILYYFSNVSVGQIAKTMKITKSNVKIRLHRARLKLRKLMEDENDEL